MRVAIRDIVGLCGRCGGDEFVAASKAPLKTVTKLTCARCGSPTTHGDLIVQIAEEAANQSRHFMRVLKQARKSRRAAGGR